MTIAYDVIIVGYGPTGMVLASALGSAGHRVAVVERWPQLYGMPRLSHIDAETARIVQAVADVDDALRDAAPIAAYRFVNAAGETLTSVGPGARLGLSGYPADLSIYQPDIEDAIDRRIAGLPGVDRLLGWEAVGLAVDGDGVSLRLRLAGQDGVDEQALTARFLVGCDGARSFTREALGISRTDFGFAERWLNIDCDIKRDLPARFAETVQYCDPARGHMHLPIGTKRQRFELALLAGEDAAAFLTPEFAWQWLGEQHGIGPDDVAIIRQVVYTFEARSADTWRSGPVLLAGDACHTMPPYLGQGACSGMRDGIALGWRLDLVLRGAASPSILDSYETERKPHTTALTQMAIGLGKIANEHDPEKARLRDEALRSRPPAKPETPFLRAGLLDPAGSALAGRVSLQGRVRLGEQTGRFDDVVGRGFVLITRSQSASRLDDGISSEFARIGGRTISLEDFDDCDGSYAAYFAENTIGCVLIRPDFIVFGTREDEREAEGLVRHLLDGLNPEAAAG